VEIPKATKAGNFTVRGVIFETCIVQAAFQLDKIAFQLGKMNILCQVNLEEHRPQVI